MMGFTRIHRTMMTLSMTGLIPFTLAARLGTSVVALQPPSSAWSAPPTTVIQRVRWVEVSTAGELEYIDLHRKRYLSANIALLQSVDLADEPHWIPLGGAGGDHPYAGTFQGNGHQVSGIVVDDPPNTYVYGFFGQTSGTIENMHVNAWVSDPRHGSYSIAGLVGNQVSGVITNCSAQVTVLGTPGNIAGGLVGNQFGQIFDSHATGFVTGGVTGGLVGGNSGHASIRDSFANTTVVGSHSYDAGGLVGFQNGPLIDDYALGSVAGGGDLGEYSGGLVGFQNGVITDCYAFDVVAGPHSGGLIGFQQVRKDIGTFFDPAIAELRPAVAAPPHRSSVHAETTQTMLTKRLYTRAGWNFDGRWALSLDVNEGLPYLVPPVPSELALSLSSVVVSIGSSHTVTGAVYDQTHQLMPGVRVYWTSTNPKVASVTSQGVITGRGLGTTDITALADGRTAVLPVVVDSTLSKTQVP